jgi:hypothetical protein
MSSSDGGVYGVDSEKATPRTLVRSVRKENPQPFSPRRSANLWFDAQPPLPYFITLVLEVNAEALISSKTRLYTSFQI